MTVLPRSPPTATLPRLVFSVDQSGEGLKSKVGGLERGGRGALDGFGSGPHSQIRLPTSWDERASAGKRAAQWAQRQGLGAPAVSGRFLASRRSECTVRCKEGFRYGATGAQSQTGVVTCEAVEGSPSEVQWGAALECVPVTCAVPEAGDFTQASTAAQEPVLYGKELPLTCDQGYGTDATDVESASYTALCTVDADYNSKYDDAGTACVELDCQPLSTIANGFTLGLSEGISSSEAFTAGSKSEFKCSTGKRVSDDYQYVTCIAGTITMCDTQDCTETTTALSDTDTACMDKAASTVTENRVNSEMTMVMSVGGRRLSAAALEDKKADLELAFRNGMAAELNLPVANVQVTGTSFKSVDATSVEVVISFYVLVPSDQEVTALESKVTSMSEDPDYDFTEFKKDFAAEMAEAGVTLSVEDIAVAGAGFVGRSCLLVTIISV